MRLWDAKNGELITVLRGHHDAAMSPVYSFDGSQVNSSSTDGTVRIWDMNLVERNTGLRRHDSFVYDVAFRPDGTRLVSGSGDRSIRIWDSLSMERRARALPTAFKVAIPSR